MMSSYVRSRRKMMLNLADHFHDKAVEASFSDAAAKWTLLMDGALWAADPDGETSLIETLAFKVVSK